MIDEKRDDVCCGFTNGYAMLSDKADSLAAPNGGDNFLSYYGHVKDCMIASPGSLHQNRQCGLVHAASKILIAVGSWAGIVLAPNLDLILAVTLTLAQIPKRQTGGCCIPC